MHLDFRQGFGPYGIYFNSANLVLVFLFILTGLNIWLHFRSQDSYTFSTEREVLVVGKESGFFGQPQYTVFLENQFWTLESPKNLDLGKLYLVTAHFQKFQLNLDQASFHNYQLSQGVVGKIKVKEIKMIETSCDARCVILTNFNWLQTWITNLYQQNSCQNYRPLLNQIASEIDCTQNSELAKGLVVGGVNFNDDLKLAIKRTGLSHVVAVSGFQISLLVSALEILTNRIGMGRNLRLSLLVGSVLGLILLVGPQPPVLRASFSSLLSVGSLLIFGRRLETWRGMVYSGLIMLWLNPFYLFSYSFLLSFAATAGLVSLNYKFFVVNPLKLLIESGLVSLSAFLWTLPILSNLSGQTSPLSVLINLIIGPLIAPVTLVNILAWLPMVGDLFGFVGAVCLQFILKVVLLTSRILPIWSVKPFGIIESGLYLLIVWLAFKIAASIRLEKHLPQTNSVELSL